MNKKTVCLSILLTASIAIPMSAADKAPMPPDAERARVFITDSQSWEMGGYSGGSGGAGGGMVHGGARPQTAEVIKTFSERCPQVMPNNRQEPTMSFCLITRAARDSSATRTRSRYSVE